MKKILIEILHRLLLNDMGKKHAQFLFERLYELSISGMNYGSGDKIENSGELAVLSYIKSQLNKNALVTLIDVGANEGQYATVLREVFPMSIIHSFEPSPAIFQILERNMKGKNISLHKVGLSDLARYTTLYASPLTSELSSLYKRRLDHFNLSMNKEERIELTTLDNFCTVRNIAFLDFLKLDIEGHELSALKGAKQMIQAKKIRFIQFEFGGTDIDSRTYFQDFWYLLNNDYKIYRVVKDGLHPILNYKETLEIFTAINYFAELKAD